MQITRLCTNTIIKKHVYVKVILGKALLRSDMTLNFAEISEDALHFIKVLLI